MNEWIDIRNRKPKRFQSVLVYAVSFVASKADIKDGYMEDAYIATTRITWLDKDGFVNIDDHFWMVTHWMPLPESPEIDKKVLKRMWKNDHAGST